MNQSLLDVINRAKESLGVTFELKDKQIESIKSFVLHGDTFVVLPTGYGKSLIFFLLPFVFDLIRGVSQSFITIVSPLNSLIDDQVGKLSRMGFDSLIAKETSDFAKEVEGLCQGKFKFLFCTPESIVDSKKWISLFRTTEFQRFNCGLVIDEAHCVSKWGKEFRPAYRKLNYIRGAMAAPTLCLTATATPEVIREFENSFFQKDYKFIKARPRRPEIFIKVKDQKELSRDINKILSSLDQNSPRTLIFFGSFRALIEFKEYCKSLPNWSTIEKYSVDYHSLHADYYLKGVLQNLVLEDTVRLILASSAFGMGVDVPGIKVVIHVGAPEDLEDYVQQIGRSARGDSSAVAILYQLKRSPFLLSPLMKDFLRNSETCRHEFIEKYFDFPAQESHLNCCDICENKKLQ